MDSCHTNIALCKLYAHNRTFGEPTQPKFKTTMTTFYFGYGSNLDLADFARFCNATGFKGAELNPVSPAWLPDYKLQFHYFSDSRNCGAADVVPVGTGSRSVIGKKTGGDHGDRGFAVPGVLFEPNEECWKALDRKEGHPNFYRRKDVVVTTPSMQVIKAVTYVCVPEVLENNFVRPSEEYVNLIKVGLEAYKLPTIMLTTAMERWITPRDESNVKHVFIYGTLRKGQGRHESMLTSDLLGIQEAVIEGKLVNAGSFPGLLPSKYSLGGDEEEELTRKKGAAEKIQVEQGRYVKGELYEYQGSMAEILTTLDAIEGYHLHPTDIKVQKEGLHLPLYYRGMVPVYREEDSLNRKERKTGEETHFEEPVWAWTYIFNYYNEEVKEMEVIESGDWVEHMKSARK